MTSLTEKQKYGFNNNEWFYNTFIDILKKNEKEIEQELKIINSNILNFTMSISILNDELSDKYYNNFQEFIKHIFIDYKFMKKYNDVFLQKEIMCVICENKYPYSMDSFIYIYSYQNDYDITSKCCNDCILEKYNTKCYKCNCSFIDPYHKIYVNKKKVYCNSCYADMKNIEEYLSRESIKSLKDCIQANMFKHLIDNKILTQDLKTNYQKIQQLYKGKGITIQIRDQLIIQIEKYHIKHLLLTKSNKHEEMTFNRILDKFELENSKKFLNNKDNQYNIEHEFKLAIKYFPEYVDCDFHCAQELTTFLIRVHRNELLKYIFEYPINITVDKQYYKYIKAIYYKNVSAIPILLENKFNFIKLKKYHETFESVIQYFISKNKKDILNLLINNINQIRQLYNLKDEDIDPVELELIKSFNDNFL